MAFQKLSIWLLLIIAAPCVGQEKVNSIVSVLTKAHTSGSISYWSKERCDSRNHVNLPSLPQIQPTTSLGTPTEILQRMFAGDEKMRVTQEAGGTLRMFEIDVPTDLLDLKIHHISFPDKYEQFRGSTFALWTIMQTPEVQGFAKMHNIKPLYSSHFPGNPFPAVPQLRGELEDVTVSHALDFVLLTYPGYWIYGNCTNELGEREVFFSFVGEVP